VPPALDRICRRALAHHPDDRYPDARSLADDLDLWLSRKQGVEAIKRIAVGALVGALLASLVLPNLHRRASVPKVPAVAPPARLVTRVDAGVPTSYRANLKSRVVHRADCRVLAAADRSHVTPVTSLVDAQNAGFQACVQCMPARVTQSAE
jgi:hypothetical protein